MTLLTIEFTDADTERMKGCPLLGYNDSNGWYMILKSYDDLWIAMSGHDEDLPILAATCAAWCRMMAGERYVFQPPTRGDEVFSAFSELAGKWQRVFEKACEVGK